MRAGEPVVALDLTAVVVLSGSAVVRIGESTHTVPARGVALVNPGTAYSVEARPGAERLVATLRSQAVGAASSRLGLAEGDVVVFWREAAGLSPALELSTRRLTVELDAESNVGRERLLDLAVDMFALDLLTDHARPQRSSRLERSRAGLVDRRLRRSVEFMHDNFSRDLQLGEIASAAYLSEYHFARLFKRLTGVTPHAYLASLRVEQARALLAETDLAIAEIASRVGYHSASHFGKIFRQATGVTPRAFREALLVRGRR